MSLTSGEKIWGKNLGKNLKPEKNLGKNLKIAKFSSTYSNI
jgi:hypothetical protein